jgi:VWFA-related protein
MPGAVPARAQDAAGQPPEQRPIFSSSVALVPIIAVVKDSKNRLVRDLKENDFEVLENNRPRRILGFNATGFGSVTLALLVDTSGSMRGPSLIKSTGIVHRLLTAMNRQSDEMALFTFDRRIRQETPFTNEPDSIRTALGATDAWGLTSLYDAIAETARQLADRGVGRRAVVVVTDGLDTSSVLSPREVSDIASAIDVPVHVLAVTPPESETAAAASGGGLSQLAAATGGDLRLVTMPEQADRTVSALMDELRHQYFFAIESSPQTGWYQLQITTRRRDVTVRARRGYFAATQPNSQPD